MANPGYMTITGKAQGLNSAGRSTPEPIGNVDLTSDKPHFVLQGDAEPGVQLSIRYREITWTHHLAGTTGHGFWGEEG